LRWGRTALSPRARRVVFGTVFGAIGVAAAVLVARRLTHSSWPLEHARPVLVATAGLCYFASLVLRARAWRLLFPRLERPRQAGCLASVGAAAASGAVLPFRLDYLVKVVTLRRLGGIRVGLEAIVLSVVSLGVIDAIAMLPLSISATATSSAALRGPLLIVVAFGIGCCSLVAAGRHVVRLPLLRRSRRLLEVAGHVSDHARPAGRRTALFAWVYLSACWTTRALGSAALLAALGHSFSPTIALCVLCLSAAAGVVPITSGGAIANVGASAAILLVLGVGKDVAINFSLASGLLILIASIGAAAAGSATALALRGRAVAGA
jgi:Lysylphosphatidylglycerol synthase TM region